MFERWSELASDWVGHLDYWFILALNGVKEIFEQNQMISNDFSIAWSEQKQHLHNVDSYRPPPELEDSGLSKVLPVYTPFHGLGQTAWSETVLCPLYFKQTAPCVSLWNHE